MAVKTNAVKLDSKSLMKSGGHDEVLVVVAFDDVELNNGANSTCTDTYDDAVLIIRNTIIEAMLFIVIMALAFSTRKIIGSIIMRIDRLVFGDFKKSHFMYRYENRQDDDGHSITVWSLCWKLPERLLPFI